MVAYIFNYEESRRDQGYQLGEFQMIGSERDHIEFVPHDEVLLWLRSSISLDQRTLVFKRQTEFLSWAHQVR